MAILIGFIAALAVVFVLMNRAVALREAELENQMLQEYTESIQELYEAMAERVEAVRRYRHDLAKHIRTLEAMAEYHSDTGEMQAYIDDLRGRYEELHEESYCTDEVVNAILSVKKRQCEEAGIPFALSVEEENYHRINDLDFVALLQNLLDNAIEAQERIPDGAARGISCSMGRQEQSIWICVENRIAPGETMTFRTKKEHPEEHGLGMKIMDSIVQKYHGTKTSTVDEQGHLFRREILLKEDGGKAAV